MKNLFLAIVVCCCFQCVAAAEIKVFSDSKYCSSETIRIRGDIRAGDARQFEVTLKAMTQHVSKVFGECIFPPQVILQSRGGDVGEALSMGKLIRDAGLATRVPYDSECFSACVFLLAAGVDRTVRQDGLRDGQVGIHRPFFGDIDERATVSSIRSRRVDLLHQIRAYFETMDISPQLVEAMLAVPPNELKVLTQDETHEYRLVGTDASFEEFQVNLNAKTFDLSSPEYRRRLAVALPSCELAAEPNICVSAKFLGIGLPEATKRWDLYQNCKSRVRNERIQRECFRRIVTHGEPR